jgi:hypothetical protein
MLWMLLPFFVLKIWWIANPAFVDTDFIFIFTFVQVLAQLHKRVIPFLSNPILLRYPSDPFASQVAFT